MSPAALTLSPCSQATGQESSWLTFLVLGVLEISLVIQKVKTWEEVGSPTYQVLIFNNDDDLDF